MGQQEQYGDVLLEACATYGELEQANEATSEGNHLMMASRSKRQRAGKPPAESGASLPDLVEACVRRCCCQRHKEMKYGFALTQVTHGWSVMGVRHKM